MLLHGIIKHRNYFTLLLLVNLIQPGYTQDKIIVKPEYGMNVSTTFSLDGIYNDLLIIPSFSWRKEKKYISIGPVFPLFVESGYNKISGMQLNYRYFPNGQHKRIDFYLEYNYFFQFLTKKYNDVVTVNGMPQIRNSRTQQFGSEHYLGYGLKMNFCKRFYINQSVALGLCNDHYRTIDYLNHYDYNSHGWQFCALIKLGIGYVFKSKTD